MNPTPISLFLKLRVIYPFIVLLSMIMTFGYVTLRDRSITGHPIDGRQSNVHWLAEARYSIDIQGAISEYTKHYGLLPPPYVEFPKLRNSISLELTPCAEGSTCGTNTQLIGHH